MKSAILNIDVLTHSRQRILKDALGGISLQMENSFFTKESREALTGIGMTSLEVRLIEEKNQGISDGEFTIQQNIKNPWKRETYNLTKQIEIMRDSPSLAESLKREANL